MVAAASITRAADPAGFFDPAATDPDGITVLETVAGRAARPFACKIFQRDAGGGVAIRDFDNAYRYRFHIRHWPDLAAMKRTLTGLVGRPHHLIVRGAPAPGLDLGGEHRRLMYPADNGDAASLQDVPRNWAALDFDLSEMPGADAPDWHSDPRGALEHILRRDLPPCFQNVDCVAMWTSGMGFKNTARWRAWFLLDRAVGSRELRAIYEALNREAGADIVDPALANPAQAHYTAAPIFRRGVADPLPGGRLFTFVGDRRRVTLPGGLAPTTAVRGSPPRPFAGRFPGAVVELLDEMRRGDAFHRQWIRAFAIWLSAFGSAADVVPLMLAVDDVLRECAVARRGQRYRAQAWRQMADFAVALRLRELRAEAATRAVAGAQAALSDAEVEALAAASRDGALSMRTIDVADGGETAAEICARAAPLRDQPRPAPAGETHGRPRGAAAWARTQSLGDPDASKIVIAVGRASCERAMRRLGLAGGLFVGSAEALARVFIGRPVETVAVVVPDASYADAARALGYRLARHGIELKLYRETGRTAGSSPTSPAHSGATTNSTETAG